MKKEKKPGSIHMYKNTAYKQTYHNLYDTDTTLLSRRCRLLAKRILALYKTVLKLGKLSCRSICNTTVFVKSKEYFDTLHVG